MGTPMAATTKTTLRVMNEAALLNSLEEGQSVLIGLLGANLSVSLWEKGRFQKQINIDELI